MRELLIPRGVCWRLVLPINPPIKYKRDARFRGHDMMEILRLNYFFFAVLFFGAVK